ncbi:MAG TPA: hypothetical protein H9744_14270 [Candidatus Eisenbergiella stercoravium]|nr:hypothetical protein [Candidatus Eisenbergiella stercoravium]
MTKEIREKIADAQMVLVGIGKELEEKYHGMEQDAGYMRLRAQAEEGEQADVLEQYLRLAWLKDHPDDRKKQAYQALADLLSGKNYFLVTLCTDDAVFGTGLDEGRIVAPCGSFRRLQCAESNEIYSDSDLWEKPVEQIRGGAPLSDIEFPRCPACGRLLAFNQITTPGYLEEGYLPQWEKYQKWLQGTLNHRLCILELGAGVEYPSVIRFPFERVAFFNQKSELIRVHSRLYQMTAELKDRGTPIQADPVDFLLE